ncbi:NAD(P)/FAD-dependent oxidoreductase [Litoreibacter roseus]|uniref:Cyclopropane-fatty-acyl-phospholipid synthase n=1 Tax=Litoreibacter roseus TaxID=2601869 RepID=A0A6N6JJ06_9RHOB|nr:FAD-dependent oxidoreductase [Litoreibacter roseus]GFE66321.1 cyclopropane-fatty-acyl-phospholipid synthase [Litoreibacter roseus]
MPSEPLSTAPKRIAVIGGGISGMAAGYLLSKTHHVTLFEGRKRLGGHARTRIAGRNGDQPVDTGFIVYNEANYPHLTKLFKDLDVPITESNMSFGASLNGGKLEYGLASMDSIFAQRRNLANPKFVKMLRDIMRFNARAPKVSAGSDQSISDFLKTLGTGKWFRDNYLLPMTGAIWSTPIHRMMDFPAEAMVRFMMNHGLMSYAGQHQWYTVQGGSIEYVRRLEATLKDQGVTIRIGAPIKSVTRANDSVEILPRDGTVEYFDEVVFATHSDDSLAMLGDASQAETAALSAVRYQPNEAILHADERMMPKRRKVWSSWVYCEEADKTDEKIDLTYWMNSLQPIPHDDPMFVTLNSTRGIREELIYDQTTFRHPVFDMAALRSQETIRAMNGTNRTWFCGAWMKNGFHEDGFGSAVDVVDAINRTGMEKAAA